jgi:GMP synthase-like glutamine amidotransferase
MQAHCLQHVPFEGMGAIETWLKSERFSISYTRFYNNDKLPEINNIDWLIIMGGPMSVNDEKDYPWLVAEKNFIRGCIAQKKKIIGICLGSQLIASALGSKIYKNAVKEIGWFPLTPVLTENIAFPDQFHEPFTAFHWHGETFDLPEGAILLASSDHCKNQIFSYDKNVIGFQCHLETTINSLESLIENCADELVPAPCIQNINELRTGYNNHATEMHHILFDILEKICLI